ncbi:MAG: hypothetical protein JJE39_09750, partial [Vicinamibacteria bacterium]|nr:hypothetical protein [Vicinamibacteria bacterium]
ALIAFEKSRIVAVVDLERLSVAWPGGEARFAIEPFERHCLLEGVDELGFLLGQDAAIAAYEKIHPRD